jgi:hypothetical protein
MTGAGFSWSKRMGIILLFLLGTLFGLWLYVFPSNRPPKEERLLEKFYSHRASYERLREMLLADEQVRAVYARWGVETTKSGLPRIPSEVNFPIARYNEYHDLLEKIGSAEVFRRSEDNTNICLTTWASGFGGDTRHVDSCWLNQIPVNEVASLDDFYKTPKPRHPSFRHIVGNWYLWADW